ncbi:hypothetical protein RJ639_046526 [Escallonia herrerae]|uniref:Carbohydrate kinase PfkB domain-containing protein n=1 Tax=Escallonia herrerae TaxID=1293975 RepID=A0AA88W6L2_9ASTE|nr:hypothetical protein RJ639_046526 [Escallonia herrerae]
MGNYADIVFANSNEARAFCHFSPDESPMSSSRYLSHFVPLVSVTDGPKGSYIGVKGEAVYIPPSPCVPVDTCGAGDAYASGILYGILRGVSDLKGMGAVAAKVAAVVVGQQGTRLRVQDAVELAESFAFHFESSTIHSDLSSDQISSCILALYIEFHSLIRTGKETARWWHYLTAERAEREGIEEAALADMAGVGDTFTRPGLRALIEEDNLGTVDDIGLNPCYVQIILLYLGHPYHIVVR